jgi:hypothetical protein
MSLYNFLRAPQNNLLKITQELVQDDPKLPDGNVHVAKHNEMVDGMIPGTKIVSLLDGNQPGGQAPPIFQPKNLKK